MMPRPPTRGELRRYARRFAPTWIALSGNLPSRCERSSDFVPQSHNSVSVFLGRAQAKRNVAMSWRHKWNPLADEHGNDMNVELVDFASVEEGGDQPATAHHPDLFAGRCAQARGKRLHGLRDEFHARRPPFWRLP